VLACERLLFPFSVVASILKIRHAVNTFSRMLEPNSSCVCIYIYIYIWSIFLHLYLCLCVSISTYESVGRREWVSLERGEVRAGAGQTKDTHELMCEDCDPLVLAPEVKRQRPSALSYAEHAPPTANVTLFSRRAWNMADLAVKNWVSARRIVFAPPLRPKPAGFGQTPHC
jgi:hypothetical protein